MLSLDVIDVKGEKDNELSQNAFDPNISSVEIKPVTTFNKIEGTPILKLAMVKRLKIC